MTHIFRCIILNKGNMKCARCACVLNIPGHFLSDKEFQWQSFLYNKADSRIVPSQWETALLCNDVSHWLGAKLEISHIISISLYELKSLVWWIHCTKRQCYGAIPDSKVYGTNTGPNWGPQNTGGHHVGLMNLAIWDNNYFVLSLNKQLINTRLQCLVNMVPLWLGQFSPKYFQ